MKHADVNNVGDYVLLEHTNAAIAALGGAAEMGAVEAAPVSQFFTPQLLHRVHIVVQLRRSGACQLPKQKVLAASVLRMTGVPIPPVFAMSRNREQAGHLVQDGEYVDEDRKALLGQGQGQNCVKSAACSQDGVVLSISHVLWGRHTRRQQLPRHLTWTSQFSEADMIYFHDFSDAPMLRSTVHLPV